MKFENLGLVAPILKALQQENYTSPTPIQEKAIPLFLDHKDILACAQTGTGKTAAFAVPIIQKIYNKSLNKQHQRRHIKALVITPTRELASQVDESFKTYAKYTGLRSAVIYGGVSQHKQVQFLKRGIDILTATPGRLLDLVQQGIVHLKQVEYFVLDEADNMLDMGFIHDIKKIISHIPRKRQTVFLSATMPRNIVKLAQEILYQPVEVNVSPVSSTAETITQKLYYTNRNTKNKLLLHLLKDRSMDQVLVFSRTKRGADRIAKDLRNKNINTSAIHSDKAQNQRQKALKQFKAGAIRVLVATDIASRGIDISKLKHVINYDIPNMPESYVHRIGRSGRAGENGMAISFCEPEENMYIRGIEKLIKQKIEVVKDHPFPQTEKPMNERERKAWNKEKNRRKQEFFAARKRKKQGGNRSKAVRRAS